MNSGASTGSIIGAVLGGIIGSLIPPQGAFTFQGIYIGATIGGIGGSIYDFATQKHLGQEQETLAELFAQTSSLGTPIPQIFGHGRVSGNVFYLGERFVEEHHNQPQGGKGGQPRGTTTKTYQIDLAIALCDTRLSLRIAGIRKIWRDSTLWYDISKDTTLPEGVTFYSGLRQQTPSPMIEATQGVGKVPGYPWLCYVTIDNYDMGLYPRVPNFTFELFTIITPLAALHQMTRRASTGEIFAAAPGVNQVHVFDSTTQDLTHEIAVNVLDPGDPSNTSLAYATKRGFPLGWENTNTALWIAHPRDYQLKRIDATTKAVTHTVAVPYSLLTNGVYLSGDTWFGGYHYGTKTAYVFRVTPSGGLTTITAGQARGGQMKLAVTATRVWLTDNHYPDGGGNSNALAIDPATNTITNTVSLGTAANSSPVDIVVTSNNHKWVLDAQANTVIRINTTPAVAATIAVSAVPLQLAVASDGYVWACTTLNGGTVYRINPATDTATAFESAPLSQYSPAHRLMEAGDNGSMWVLSIPTWTTQKFATDGTITLVSTEGTPRGQVAESTTHIWTNTTRGLAQKLTAAGATVHTNSTYPNRLRGIIQTLCVEAGLDLSDVDVTRIPNPYVAFKLVNVQSARSILENLMHAYLFFAIESNLQLKFLPREPGNVEATITEDELDAYDASSGEPPRQRGLIIGPRLADEELPTELRISYVSRQRNFQEDTAVAYVSNSRSAGRNTRAIALPIVLTPTQAQRVAQESLDLIWQQRMGYRFTTNRDYAHLEPGDRVLVTSRGIQHSIVLSEVSVSAPGILEFVGRGDTTGVVNQHPKFAGLGSATQKLPSEAHTTGRFLNLPALTSADQDPRYHVAYEYPQTFWRGATAHRSVDGGVIYSQLDSSTQARAITGLVASALANAPSWYVFDDTSTFSVVLVSGTLASASDAELFAGGNLAMLGNELLQFGTATLTAPLTYTCSHLLRGRRGTEWATTGHGSNERFVLLNNAVREIAMLTSDRNVSRLYKAVTIGVDISTVTAAAFIPTGENLVPWTVAGPQAVRTGNDWVLTWMARSRFSGEWSDGQPFGYDPDFLLFRVHLFTDDGYGTIVRTIDVTPALDAESTQTTTYTSAQQVTDFGSNQSTIYWRVAQIGSYGAGRTTNLVGV